MLLKRRRTLFYALCTSTVLIALFFFINVPQAHACRPVSVQSVYTTDQSDSHKSAFIDGQRVLYQIAVDNPSNYPVLVDLRVKISPTTYGSADARNLYSSDTILPPVQLDPGVHTVSAYSTIPENTSPDTYTVQVAPYNNGITSDSYGGNSQFTVQQPDLSSLVTIVGTSPVTKMIGDIISQVDGPISIIPDAISCLSDLNQTRQAQIQGAPGLDLIGQTLYSCGKTALKGLLYILKDVPEVLESDAPELAGLIELL